MKKLLVFFLTMIFAASAYADRGPGGFHGPWGFRGHEAFHDHGGGGFWIGPAIVGGMIAYDLAYPYRYPYYYPYTYPYPVYTQPTYAAPSAPIQAPAQVWYYCDSAKGYYPYVTSCPEAWRPVPAQPPPPAASPAPQQ